jgi:hypothetical protein
MHTIVIGGTYRHYKKGTLYKVLAVGLHCETLEEMVVYEALYDNPTSKVWIRPAAMFEEEVEVEGKKVRRFEKVHVEA